MARRENYRRCGRGELRHGGAAGTHHQFTELSDMIVVVKEAICGVAAGRDWGRSRSSSTG